MRQIAPRLLALALGISLSFPNPAYALRAPQRERHAQTTGLEESLRSNSIQPAPSAAVSAAATSAVFAGGLEESGGFERLGLRAWFATFGSWKPTKQALSRIENRSLRLSIRGEINRLVKGALKRGEDPKSTLRSGIPMAFQVFSAEVLSLHLPFLFRLGAIPGLEWNQIYKDELGELAADALKLEKEGVAYRIAVTPARGHFERRVDAEGYERAMARYEEAMDLHDDAMLNDRSDPGIPGLPSEAEFVRSEFVIDEPQKIALISHRPVSQEGQSGLEESTGPQLDRREWMGSVLAGAGIGPLSVLDDKVIRQQAVMSHKIFSPDQKRFVEISGSDLAPNPDWPRQWPGKLALSSRGARDLHSGGFELSELPAGHRLQVRHSSHLFASDFWELRDPVFQLQFQVRAQSMNKLTVTVREDPFRPSEKEEPVLGQTEIHPNGEWQTVTLLLNLGDLERLHKFYPSLSANWEKGKNRHQLLLKYYLQIEGNVAPGQEGFYAIRGLQYEVRYQQFNGEQTANRVGVIAGATAAAGVAVGAAATLAVKRWKKWHPIRKSLRRYRDLEKEGQLYLKIHALEKVWSKKVANQRDKEVFLQFLPELFPAIPPARLAVALDAANRLAGEGINPLPLFQSLLSVLSQASLTDVLFLERIHILEDFMRRSNKEAAWVQGPLVNVALAVIGNPVLADRLEDSLLAVEDYIEFIQKDWPYSRDSLTFVVPGIAKGSTSSQDFSEKLKTAVSFPARYQQRLEQKLGKLDSIGTPHPLVQYVLPALAESSPTADVLLARESLVADFALRLHDQGISPQASFYRAVPAVVRMSSDPDRLSADLKILEEFISQWIGKQIQPAAFLDALVPVAARASDSSTVFQQTLAQLDQFAVQQVLAGKIDRVTAHLVPAASSAKAPEHLQAVLGLLEDLGRQKELDWSKVAPDQLSQVGQAAIGFAAQGGGYRVEVVPERGHMEQQAQEGWQGDDLYGSNTTYYVDVYIMDSPQQIRLVSGGTLPVFQTESLILGDAFLKNSGILRTIAEEGIGTHSWHGRRHPSPPSAYSLGGRQVQGAVFDIPEPNRILPRYYPLTALGQRVVLRVYERGLERTLAPVRTILARGEFGQWSYQLIPREEFDAMFEPDGMSDWAITVPSGLPWLGEKQVAPSEVTLRHLEERNWNWREVSSGKGEIPKETTLTRIDNLKKSLPWTLKHISQPGWSMFGPDGNTSLYALGSWVWGAKPNDLDLIMLTAGDTPYQVLEPRKIEGLDQPIHLRVVGLNTLRRAISGEPVENAQRVRLEALVLYGSAVLIAGYDPFAENRPPAENFGKLAQFLREKAESLSSALHLDDSQRREKAEHWTREALAIDQFASGLEEGVVSAAQKTVRSLRFIVDTGAGEAGVLRLLEMAVQLKLQQGLPIAVAGVATEEELAEAEAAMPDDVSRESLHARVFTYTPGDEESHRIARAFAENSAPELAGLHPELVITEMNRSTVTWFLQALQRLGVNRFTHEMFDRVESYLTAT